MQKRAIIFALIAILLWSTVATAFKIALSTSTFIELLFFSSIFSLLALFIILIIQKKIKILFSLKAKDIIIPASLGFLNPFLYYLILFKSYSLLPAQIAQPLNYTWPIVLVILSAPILKQKIGTKGLISIIISFVGVIIISLQGSLENFAQVSKLGVSLAVGSSVIWASYWLFNVKSILDEMVKLFLNFLFGVLYIGIYILVLDEISMPDFKNILSFAYIGLFEMSITFAFWITALKLTNRTDSISILVYISPFTSLIFIYFILHESINFSTVIGLVFIISGIIIQKVKRINI